MKSFSQFCAEATVLAKLGGVQGKLDKITGKFTKGAWSDTESARYQKYSNPATTTSTPSPQGSTPSPAPRPAPKKDERPTNREVAATRREAEYQRRARNLRLGVELGGVAKLAAQQNYANYNSPAMKAHRARMAGSVPQWKQHQFTQDSPYPNKPKDRDYGIPDYVSDRRRENRSAMASNNRSLGMSNADAEAKARRNEAELHRKNMKYMKNRRDGYKD